MAGGGAAVSRRRCGGMSLRLGRAGGMPDAPAVATEAGTEDETAAGACGGPLARAALSRASRARISCCLAHSGLVGKPGWTPGGFPGSPGCWPNVDGMLASGRGVKRFQRSSGGRGPAGAPGRRLGRTKGSLDGRAGRFAANGRCAGGCHTWAPGPKKFGRCQALAVAGEAADPKASADASRSHRSARPRCGRAGRTR